MSCALRKPYRVELFVLAELSRLYAEEMREFKTELKLEKLGHGDVVVRVVGSHGESAGKRCLDTGSPKKFWRNP